jgi:CheY-like chemotaxis protein
LSRSPEAVRHFSLRSLARQTNESWDGPGPHIILVEDNPADVGLVREALEEHGAECELTVITDGESAIRFIQELDFSGAWRPDLIILDLNLPRKTGYDVLECLRASLRLSGVPAVILSSSNAKKDREKAAKLGVSMYIQKPTHLGEFIKLGGVFKGLLDGESGTQLPTWEE